MTPLTLIDKRQKHWGFMTENPELVEMAYKKVWAELEGADQ